MLEQHLRQIASVLLETSIRIAPPEARDWGRGMLGELTYVERPWSAIWWAVGGASVLAKSALLSFFIPGRAERALVPDGDLFAKSFPLRKVTLAICGVFVLGTLLFFFGPPFRQGVRISLAAWHDVLLNAALGGELTGGLGRGEPLGVQVFGREVAARNALVLHIATLALFVFSVMVVLAGAALGFGAVKRGRHAPPRPQPVAWAALLAGALGSLLSSATSYLTYRPYWYIYQNQVMSGGRGPAGAARDFLTVAQCLEYYGFSPARIPLYFWMGVILLSASGVIAIFLRQFPGRPRANSST